MGYGDCVKSMTGKSIAAFLCAGLFLTACAGGETGADRALPEEHAAEIFTVTRLDGRTCAEAAQEINLDECSGMVEIESGGEYVLRGSLEGRIVIDAYEDEPVQLYLDGVEITSPAGPAVCCLGASKLIVTVVSDTENVLSDAADYEGYEDTQACLYSVPDLTLNGDGALRVYGYHGDGIRSKDRVKILGAQAEVQAKGDGIRGNDGILLKQALVDVQSEAHGIRTANQGADSKGVLEIQGGTLSVVAGRNGIYAASDLYMTDCVCSVNSVQEKVRAEGMSHIAEGCLAK